MDGIWDPPYYQANEDTLSFCLPYDVIEETNINEKCCIQVLEILISKADTDIVEHEEVLMDLLSQLACTDKLFSDMFSMSLRAKIDFLDSSIRKLKDDAEDFLSTSREPAESIYDILKSLFYHYSQKKDLQKFADNTGTASSSFCQVSADNRKKQVGSSSDANKMKKIKTVNITPVEKQTTSKIIVKVEKETDYPHSGPISKYSPRSLFWGSTKKTDREVSKFQIKSPIIVRKDIVQNRTPGCKSICSKSSLETQGKCKRPLKVIKPQTYDENMSLATVPYVESSKGANSNSNSNSKANANAKQIVVKELDFPPGFPNPLHHQKRSRRLSLPRSLYSNRTYTRRKKPSSPLQTSSNSPCLALVVANPLDNPETNSNTYMEGYYTVNDLRAIAKQQQLKGYSKFRKAELAQALGIKIIEGRRKRQKRSERQLQLVPVING